MKDPSATYQPNIFGIQGVPDTANNPGARHECAISWTDTANNLWLFGGLGITNDLWKYDISTNRWTWVKGNQSTTANYGVMGVENSINIPSGRGVYSNWKDRFGNFWFFGGLILGESYNDMWRYNPVTNNWTWMGGGNVYGISGEYGNHCEANEVNIPGHRYENRASWTDACGNFWMMGGANSHTQAAWNDLWFFNVASNKWVWMSGDTLANPIGYWGIKGVPNPANKPNGRMGAVSWKDNSGHLYLFGGYTSGAISAYNDLWKFTMNPSCGTCSQVLPIANLISSDILLR